MKTFKIKWHSEGKEFWSKVDIVKPHSVRVIVSARRHIEVDRVLASQREDLVLL